MWKCLTGWFRASRSASPSSLNWQQTPREKSDFNIHSYISEVSISHMNLIIFPSHALWSIKTRKSFTVGPFFFYFLPMDVYGMTLIDASFYVHTYMDGKSVPRLRHTWKCVPTSSPFSAYTHLHFWLFLVISFQYYFWFLMTFHLFHPFLSFHLPVSSLSSLNTFISHTEVAAYGLLVFFLFVSYFRVFLIRHLQTWQRSDIISHKKFWKVSM